MTKLALRWATHLAALTPLAVLALLATQGRLTANPIQDMTLRTGKTALILLILSLAITPLVAALGVRELLPLRRRLGLYAFFYAALHFLIFVGLDYGFDLALLRQAVFEKRYALAGLAAFSILLPLAVTSSKRWMRRLGKRWKPLHRAVYLAAVLAIVHYVWLVKSDVRTPLLYGAVVLGLLALRLPPVSRRLRAAARRSPGAWRALPIQGAKKPPDASS